MTLQIDYMLTYTNKLPFSSFHLWPNNIYAFIVIKNTPISTKIIPTIVVR